MDGDPVTLEGLEFFVVPCVVTGFVRLAGLVVDFTVGFEIVGFVAVEDDDDVVVVVVDNVVVVDGGGNVVSRKLCEFFLYKSFLLFPSVSLKII